VSELQSARPHRLLVVRAIGVYRYDSNPHRSRWLASKPTGRAARPRPRRSARVSDQRVTEPGSRYIISYPRPARHESHGSGLWGGILGRSAPTKKLLKPSWRRRCAAVTTPVVLCPDRFLFLEVAALVASVVVFHVGVRGSFSNVGSSPCSAPSLRDWACWWQPCAHHRGGLRAHNLVMLPMGSCRAPSSPTPAFPTRCNPS